MLYDTPFRDRHQAWIDDETRRLEAQVNDTQRPGAAMASRGAGFEIEYIPYGPADDDGEPTCALVSAFGPVEPEYASLRRDVGILDAPHRTIIEVRGADRLSFLDSMITQKVGDLAVGSVRSSFWLNRKGRIVSDLCVANLEDRTLLELDVHLARETLESLDNYLFAEDVTMEWTPERWTQLRLNGPATIAALQDLLDEGEPPESGGVHDGVLGGVPVTMIRSDDIGEPGIILIMEQKDAGVTWDALVAWRGSNEQRMRPIGWSAFNAARIEAGTPLFNVDFGGDSIPQETGVVDDRVSFNKGCYLGQEIVARIHSLGNPRQRIISLDLDTDLLPVAGSQVYERMEMPDGTSALGPQVGVITSSTVAPMLGARPVAFGMVRFNYSSEGTRLLLTAEGEEIEATVRDRLGYLPGASS